MRKTDTGRIKKTHRRQTQLGLWARVPLACILSLLLPLSACAPAAEPEPTQPEAGPPFYESEIEEPGGRIRVQAPPALLDYYTEAARRVMLSYPGTQVDVVELESAEHMNRLAKLEAVALPEGGVLSEAAAVMAESSSEAASTAAANSATTGAADASAGAEKGAATASGDAANNGASTAAAAADAADAAAGAPAPAEQQAVTVRKAADDEVCDVFLLPLGRLPLFQGADKLSPLHAPRMAQNVKADDEFTRGLLENYRIGREYYAFPFTVETLLAYVNGAKEGAAELSESKPYDLGSADSWQRAMLPYLDVWYMGAVMNSVSFVLLSQDETGRYGSSFTLPWEKQPGPVQELFSLLYRQWQDATAHESELFKPVAAWSYIEKGFGPEGEGWFRLGSPADYRTILSLAGADAASVKILPLNVIRANGSSLSQWQNGWGLALRRGLEVKAEEHALGEAMIKELCRPSEALLLYRQSAWFSAWAEEKDFGSGLDDQSRQLAESLYRSIRLARLRPPLPDLRPLQDRWMQGILFWEQAKPADAPSAYELLSKEFVALVDALNINTTAKR